MKFKRQIASAVAVALTLGCAASLAACSNKSEGTKDNSPDFEKLALSDVYKEQKSTPATYTASKLDAGEGFTLDTNNSNTGYGILIFKNENAADGEAHYKYYSTKANKFVLTVNEEYNENYYYNSDHWGVCALEYEDVIYQNGSYTYVEGISAFVLTEYDSSTYKYTLTLINSDGTTLDSYSSSYVNYSDLRGYYLLTTMYEDGTYTFNGTTYPVDTTNGKLVAQSDSGDNPFAVYASTSDFDETVGDYCYDQRGNVLTIYGVKEDDTLGDKVADYELPEASSVEWFPLANGDVLIQTVTIVDDGADDYDAYCRYLNLYNWGNSNSASNFKFNYSHYIYDVSEKKAEEITMNYMVQNVYANVKDGKYEDLYADTVQNVAGIVKISDGVYDVENYNAWDAISLNNNGTVAGAFIKSTKSGSLAEIEATYQGKYTDGYYLYDSDLNEIGYIYGTASNSAYFVTSNAIYDYSLTKKYDISANKMTVMGLTETGVVLKKTETDGTEYYLYKNGSATKLADTADGDEFFEISTTSTGTGYTYKYYALITKADGTTTFKICDYEGNTLESVTGETNSSDAISRISDNMISITRTTTVDGTTTTATEFYTISVKD